MDPVQIDSFKTAVDTGVKLTQGHAITGFKPVLTAPHLPGGSLLLTPDKQPQPRFLTAKPAFHETAPFIEYVNAFKETASRIFYRADGTFTAVLDYHSANGRHAQHGDHLAVLGLQRSPEWKAWAAKSEESMSQQEFAEFIEDNLRDLLQPEPAEMLEIATGLHATVGATFRSAINQSNGTVQLQWDEQVEGTVRGTGKQIPATFTIAVRPFMGCERYPVDCRLRYRVNGGRLALHFKALHLEPITEAALEAAVSAIADQTGIKPALGEHDPVAFKRGE